MPLLRLVESQIQVSVPLPWHVRLSDGSLLLVRGHVIQSQHQLDLLLERGAYVDPKEVEGHIGANAAESDETPMPARRVSLFELWEKAIRQLEDTLKGFPEEPDFPARLETLAGDIMDLVKWDADIAIYVALRQEKVAYVRYGYAHAVHTALICTLMARRMKWPEDLVMTLAKAALTMNAPIMTLQGRLAGQEGPVLDKQKAELRLHPGKAVDWLKQVGVTNEDWLTAVAQHHERVDGTGYPLGLVDVSIVAKVLRYADVFMAKISRRVAREPLSTQEAARQLFHVDNGGKMSLSLIREIGIYPPGDFVKLKSGELAVVVKRSENPKTPMVACITDTSGKLVVSTARRDTSIPEFAITGAVADKSMALRVPPERLFGFSAVGG